MKNRFALVAVFIFILVVMFFLFPRGCAATGAPADSAAAKSRATR